MAFTSASFIVLTIASVLLYYIVPKKAQWCILLLASAAFYMAGSVKAFAWVVLVAGMTWVTGLILGRYNAIKPADKAQKAQIQHKKKQIAIICAVCCFGLLYAMKYWNFTLELLPSALGNHIPRWDFVVPLGLSFFIFQSMSYVIDVYRGKYAPERNPLRYGLFVSFFPQMVQGPISRFDQLAPQLTAERKLCWDDLQIGIQLALWGYFKKIVIADRAAVLVNNVIMENCPYGGAVIALGILFYCIQLYCDFSGGIDITRGVARMFGIDMTLNFRRPLFSTSLTDYWRRWHITLGAWMRDYVFYPLAFSKPFGKLGKWARKHFKGMMGKDLCHLDRYVYRVFDHRHLARRQLPLHCVRPVERYPHYRFPADGAPLPFVEEKAAHQRQIDRLAYFYDRPHVRAGVYRPLFHPCTASQDCIHAARNDRAAPAFQ